MPTEKHEASGLWPWPAFREPVPGYFLCLLVCLGDVARNALERVKPVGGWLDGLPELERSDGSPTAIRFQV